MLKNLDEDDRIQIQKEAEVLADNPDSEFFGQYNKALNALAQKKIYGVQFMPGEERKKSIEANAAEISKNMRVNSLVANRMATFEYDFDSIQKKNDDLSFDIENLIGIQAEKLIKEGLLIMMQFQENILQEIQMHQVELKVYHKDLLKYKLIDRTYYGTKVR